jgi:hypothetical protein
MGQGRVQDGRKDAAFGIGLLAAHLGHAWNYRGPRVEKSGEVLRTSTAV